MVNLDAIIIFISLLYAIMVLLVATLRSLVTDLRCWSLSLHRHITTHRVAVVVVAEWSLCYYGQFQRYILSYQDERRWLVEVRRCFDGYIESYRRYNNNDDCETRTKEETIVGGDLLRFWTQPSTYYGMVLWLVAIGDLTGSNWAISSRIMKICGFRRFDNRYVWILIPISRIWSNLDRR